MRRTMIMSAVAAIAAGVLSAGTMLPVGTPLKQIYQPDFRAQLEGKDTRISLRELAAKNKVVVFSFFHSTCKSCKNEIPAVQKIVDNYTNKGVALFFVCIEQVDVNNGESWSTEGTARVQKVVEEWKITYPIADDHHMTAANVYKVTSAPSIFMVSDGKIQYSHSGWEGEKSSEDVEATIKRLLK